MAENITLNNVATFQNDTSAVNTVNNNNTAIVNAFADVLSRSGVSPNQMTSTLDMNNNQIINLPPPSTTSSPARLIDVTTAGSITINTALTGTSGHTVPFLDGVNTWSGIQSLSAGVNSSISNPSVFTTSNVFNSFSVATDNLDASAIGNVATQFNVYYGIGGSVAKGARQGFEVNTQLTSPTSATNTNRNYVGGVLQGQAVSGDGGGIGTEKGAIFGGNSIAILNAAATSMSGITSHEFDITCTAGSSVLDKWGIGIVQSATDTVSGSRNDAAIRLSNVAGAVGWSRGIQFGDGINAFPVKAGGTLIKTVSGSITNGVDLSATTFSGSAFSSTNFSVGGGGAVSLGTNGALSGILQFNGSVSGQTQLTVNTTGNLLTINQPIQTGVIGTTAGSLTIAGLTSGSTVLSCSATGGTLQLGAGNLTITSGGVLATNGTITTGAAGLGNGQITIQGNTSGSVVLTTPTTSAGLLQFNSAGSFAANGAVATALTSVGPTGSHTTVQTWLTIVDNTGTQRWIPCF